MVSLTEIGKNNQNTQDALASINADKREMLLLASLIHPNLPRIYDYCVENHRWYFVMDFLAGETLEAYLIKRKYRPLSVAEVLDSGLQLSAVLDYLLIHQPSLDLTNLTLRNIWRTPDGNLYLLDTGTTFPSPVMSAGSSIYSLGKILPWSPNGMRLVMGNSQGHVQAFDADTGPNGISFQADGLSSRVEDVKWLANGNAIAAGGDDSIVWIWIATTGQLQQTYRKHTGWVISRAWSPDAQRIASGDKSGTVGIWSVTLFEGIQPQQEIPVSYNQDTRASSNQNNAVQAVAWSPNGKYIASGGLEATVQVWNAKL